MSGTGMLTLTGNNAFYLGPTTISSGTLQFGNGGTTGPSNTSGIIDNGFLVFNVSPTASTTSVAIPSAGISGSGSVSATAYNMLINGNVTTGGSQSYTVANAGTLYSAGAILPAPSAAQPSR